MIGRFFVVPTAARVFDDVRDYARDHEGNAPPWLNERIAELSDAEISKLIALMRTHKDLAKWL